MWKDDSFPLSLLPLFFFPSFHPSDIDLPGILRGTGCIISNLNLPVISAIFIIIYNGFHHDK